MQRDSRCTRRDSDTVHGASNLATSVPRVTSKSDRQRATAARKLLRGHVPTSINGSRLRFESWSTALASPTKQAVETKASYNCRFCWWLKSEITMYRLPVCGATYTKSDSGMFKRHREPVAKHLVVARR